jgi:hypothetical protein
MTTVATRERRLRTPWNGRLARVHPIFWPLRRFAEPFVNEVDFPTVAAIDAHLAGHAQVRFREQAPRPRRSKHKTPSQPYDASIVLVGEVPTRARSWHDFMNALVWAAFPRAKRALHQHQHAFVTTERLSGDPGRRLPAHDALAVLDEGGVIVVSDRALPDEKMLDQAVGDGSARAIVFGHAIFEAIAIDGPWPLVRAVPLVLPDGLVDEQLVHAVDESLAAFLSRDSAPSRPQDLPPIALARLAWLNRREPS